MPVILCGPCAIGGKPKPRFRDTIGDRLVAGVVIAVVAFCSTLIPRWLAGQSFTFRERLTLCAVGFVAGFIRGDRIDLNRIIPLEIGIARPEICCARLLLGTVLRHFVSGKPSVSHTTYLPEPKIIPVRFR